VYANCSGLDPRYPPDMEDNFLINLRFKNGKIGRILAIYGIVEPPLPMLSLGVYGKKGTVVDDRVIFDKIEGKPEWKMSFRPEAGHGNEVMRYMLHFEECIIHDKKPLIDARDGAKVIATAAACWESIRTGKPAKVRNEF
jgi:predicted dehydrogenase